MADLFEEYGALEYQPPKKKCKLPKFLNPRKPILWLGIAAIAIGAVALVCWLAKDTPPVLTEEERIAQTLEKCEKALTEFQNQDSCCVRLVADNSVGLLQDYWRCDGDLYYTFMSNDALFQGYLQKGDEQYFFGTNQIWERSSFSEQELRLRWLDSYRWNGEDITLISQKTVGAGEKITLQIAGAVDPGVRYQDMESYTVVMDLDKAGMLTAVKLSYTVKKTEETRTYQINSISREEVSQTIEMAYADVVDQIAQKHNPMLEKCRQALEELRSLKRYQVYRKSESQGGDSLTNYAETTYWRCGEDFLKETWIEESQTRRLSVQKGAARYGGSYDSESGEMVWGVLVGGTDLMIPWLETYNWDSRDVISVSEMENLVMITFKGDPYYGVDGSAERYNVCFVFEESGLLTSIQLAYVKEDGGIHSSVFDIISTDTQEIAQTIDEAYEEAVLQVRVG